MESDSFSIETVLADFENRFTSNLATEKLIDFWEFLENKTKKILATEIDETSKPAAPQISYLVPELSEDASCSLHTVLRTDPFVLNPFLSTTLLKQWRAFDFVIEALQNVTESDWAGVYLRLHKSKMNSDALAELKASHINSDEFLVKVAYRGKPSRALFPISKDFVSKSNNVNSVWNNRTILIRDVRAHAAAGGSYYQCDPLVQSELCLPISREGRVEGLIDLEGFHKDQFSERDIGYALVASQFILRLLHTI